MDSPLISSRQLASKLPPGTSLDKQVWAVYNDLQSTVDSMDRRVQLVMQKHESQFLVAYRSHIHKIKKQLEDIKRKSEEQQRLFSSNDRIRYLEKEVAVFRDQALKLYDSIDRKTLELEIAKQKINDAEATAKKLEVQNKQLAIQVKKMTITENNLTRSIEELETRLEEQNKNVEKLQMKLFSQRSRRDYMLSIRDHASSLAKSRDQSSKQIKTYRNELQDWFLECVKTVKKQIYQRKNNFDTLDLNQVNNINDFRLVDKLRLFELVLENQKLLNWLYHKIFPDKFDQISQSLSQTKPRYFSSESKNSQAPPSQRSIEGGSVSILPKIGTKSPRLSLRNKISMKNGKINISFA